MKKRPFAIDAVVILPEHLHCIRTLPPNDADFSTRWRLIKTWFTKHCDNKYKVKPNPPVKHGYVNKPSDWKYSSFHRYVKQSIIADN